MDNKNIEKGGSKTRNEFPKLSECRRRHSLAPVDYVNFSQSFPNERNYKMTARTDNFRF